VFGGCLICHVDPSVVIALFALALAVVTVVMFWPR
jgi:hypothetical protein